MPTTVPNLFPQIPPGTARLAVIGDAPHHDDTLSTDSRGNPNPQPFMSTSGRALRAILAGTGIACDQVFFGNVCQLNPPQNDIERFDYNGPEIQSGLQRLRSDLEVFRPHCVLLLGETPLRAFNPTICRNSKGVTTIPLADWRGSVFLSDTFGYKSIATYHPSHILRAYSDAPYFKFDIARAVRHSRDTILHNPVRSGTTRPNLEEVLAFCHSTRERRTPVTFDIEGYADDVGITMVSFCTSATDGIVIPFWIDGGQYWTLESETLVWQAVSALLADPLVRKTAHNAFYELFVLAWRHRCVVANLYDDTMMKHWEVFPEAAGDASENDTGKKKRQGLGRSLADCCSIYTEQPFYKGDRLSDSTEVKLRYNLTDSQVTHEVNIATHIKLSQSPRSYEHYRFNINLIPAYTYMMLRGCRVDMEKVRELEKEVITDIATLNEQIQNTLGREFNVKSVTHKKWLLYEHLGYKPLKRWGFSTAEDAFLHYHSKEQHPLIRLVLRCIRKRTRLSDIHKLIPNTDGRIRTSLDLVGTNSGRISSRASMALEWDGKCWDNTGTNLQNVTKELRVVAVPDSLDYDFWQLDLSGADGWTVGADLAILGHSAMLEDYLAGIKPALVLYYMLQQHALGKNPGDVNKLDRPALKAIMREMKQQIAELEGRVDSQGVPLDWQYRCCKAVQHGSNYGAQPQKIADLVFKKSDATIVLTLSDAEFYQRLYKLRYNTDARNESIARKLRDTGYLQADCGIRRQFFSIRSRAAIDDATIREASAFTPQANTTWATNKALERLWYDPANRKLHGSLFIEPLMQNHDALGGQYKKHLRSWAHEKLNDYFTNPLLIAGTKITIPAEGAYGPNWRDTKTPIISE